MDDEEDFLTEDPALTKKEVIRRAWTTVILVAAGLYICVMVTLGILKSISLGYQSKDLGEQQLELLAQTHEQTESIESLLTYTESLGSVEANRQYLASALEATVEASNCQTREALQDVVSALKDSGAIGKDFPPVVCDPPAPPIPGS